MMTALAIENMDNRFAMVGQGRSTGGEMGKNRIL